MALTSKEYRTLRDALAQYKSKAAMLDHHLTSQGRPGSLEIPHEYVMAMHREALLARNKLAAVVEALKP